MPSSADVMADLGQLANFKETTSSDVVYKGTELRRDEHLLPPVPRGTVQSSWLAVCSSGRKTASALKSWAAGTHVGRARHGRTGYLPSPPWAAPTSFTGLPAGVGFVVEGGGLAT